MYVIYASYVTNGTPSQGTNLRQVHCLWFLTTGAECAQNAPLIHNDFSGSFFVEEYLLLECAAALRG